MLFRSRLLEEKGSVLLGKVRLFKSIAVRLSIGNDICLLFVKIVSIAIRIFGFCENRMVISHLHLVVDNCQ